MQVIRTITQKLDHPDAGTYFGMGKVKELGKIAKVQRADFIIVNDELSPSQIRNLEKQTNLPIIDRTGLILEIFANRARTKEAKLQIHLARLKYQLPRLRTSAAIRLDQQTGTGGGNFTNRGSGETLIEMKRRTLTNQMNNIRHHLKALAKTKRTKSKRRRENPIPNVALVGYTNAGKSTLMNQILRACSHQRNLVPVKNMLFATLSTKIRKINLPDRDPFMLSDTVGFVSQLPHQLISAFRSTLSEAANADLLIQIVDYSSSNRQLMMNTTQQTLKNIGIHNIPMITVFNKADRTDTDYPIRTGNNIIMSARDSQSVHELLKMINAQLDKQYVIKYYLIPFTRGKWVAFLDQNADVIQTKYLNKGTRLKVRLSRPMAKRLQKYQITL